MSTKKRVLGGVLAGIVGLASTLFLSVAPAMADNGPHVKVPLNAGDPTMVDSSIGINRCASCHRAHTGQTNKLLSSSNQTQMCYTCHGSGGMGADTDVRAGIGYGEDAEGNTTVAALRGGGFVTAMIGAGEASKKWGTGNGSTAQTIPALSTPETTTSNHMGGPNVVWGSGGFSATAFRGVNTTPETQLQCGTCHDPHGNGNYRILRPIANANGSGNAGVVIPDTTHKEYTTADYWKSADVPAYDADLEFRTGTQLRASADGYTPVATPITVGGRGGVPVTASDADKYIANVAAWCTQCHTRYLAGGNGTGRSYNTTDALFKYRHTSDYVTSEESTRNCITCHVAHGSNAAIDPEGPSAHNWPGQALTVKSADSRLLRVDERGICLMCHNK